MDDITPPSRIAPHRELPRSSQDWCTLVDLLRWRATQEPDRQAYTFLADGETVRETLTYGELDQQASDIAATLQQTLPRGARALLMFQPGLSFISAFFGCLYSGVIAVPVAYPHSVRIERSVPRLRAIAANAEPGAIITTSASVALAQQLRGQIAELQAAPVVASDAVPSNATATFVPPQVQSTSLAFLQYTSGSTALPKGVMVSHSNILHNLANLDAGFAHTRESVMVSWLPMFHDMGLIYGVLQALYSGFPDILMSPMAFLQRPGRWLKAISRYGATHSAAPNFAYDLCVHMVDADQRALLDLSSWQVALNGAEPVRGETLRRFSEAFSSCGFSSQAFCPGYGLAEATLKVSTTPIGIAPVQLRVQAQPLEQNRIIEVDADQLQAKTLVSSGHPALDTNVVIVDPETLRRCPVDQIGEIWVAGSGVTQGYWNRADETQHTFRAHLADTGEGPFLRTGDLGFIRHGELFITGRLKDLIIVDGRNLYPQDIEHTVEQHTPAVRGGCCAAFSVDIAGEERLVVVAEVDRRYQAQRQAEPDGVAAEREALIRAIRNAVTQEHDVQPYAVKLLKLGGVLKTSSGKIQRRACRAKFLDQTLDLWGE